MNLLLALTILGQVQVRDAPKDWKLVTTEHFNIYYPSEELQTRARQFAGWFEEGRRDLVRKTGVEPSRVNVFVYRSFHDLLQSSYLGSARTLSARIRTPGPEEGKREEPPFCRPNPRARALALSEPLQDRIFIHCQASDRWNAWFARHELAHQFQFRGLFPTKIPSWLLALKSPLTPWWFWEGGADYLAGIFDSAKDQYVRDLAGERLYDLKELFFPDILNPHDAVAVYNEGSYFWRFVEEAYGAETARRIFEAYGREMVAIPSTRPLEEAAGRTRAEMEREFTEFWQARWKAAMDGRGVPSERLTDNRSYYPRSAWGGRWSPDGERLAWVGDRDVWPELYVDGKGLLGIRRGIDTGYIVSAPSWSPDGRRLAFVEWTTNRDDLVLVDLDGSQETLKLDFDEIADPAWSPDGTKIAFAALKNGTGDLYTVRLVDRVVERLTDDPDADSEPAWSRDGRLAFLKETAGHTVLHILGRGAVTKSWALLESPQWSPDGKSIVVAADVDGVYDAFSVDPTTGEAERLTRFRGGVSYPAWHPDGSLVVTYYEGRGRDLYRVRPEPRDEPGFDQASREGWYDQFRLPDPQGEPAEKERVWDLEWLMFPVTSASLVTPGVEFALGDRDAENRLSLFGSGSSSRSWTAGATAVNTRWRPSIGATAWAARTADLQEESVNPFVEVPLWTTVTTGAGWIVRERRQVEEDWPDPEFRDSGPEVSVLFSNRQGYQYRDLAWGFSFGGTARYFSERTGGERRLKEHFAFVEASTDIVQDWIAWTRATWEDRTGDELLEDELLRLEDGVRGAEFLEGPERGVVSVELRFPLWRDFLWTPLEFMGAGEWLVLKDLRGFLFAQGGYAGTEIWDAGNDVYGAAGTGAGLRLDFFWMLWPLVNGRVPTRLEFWWALVGQDGEDARGAAGAGVQLGF